MHKISLLRMFSYSYTVMTRKLRNKKPTFRFKSKVSYELEAQTHFALKKNGFFNLLVELFVSNTLFVSLILQFSGYYCIIKD